MLIGFLGDNYLGISVMKEQKKVIEKGLVTMEDVEMVAAEGIFVDSFFLVLFFSFFHF